MHKVTNGGYLENISNLFVVKNNDNLIIIYAIIISIIHLKSLKQTFFKKSISYSSAKTRNDLPVKLKSSCWSLNAFKTLLRDRSRLK